MPKLFQNPRKLYLKVLCSSRGSRGSRSSSRSSSRSRDNVWHGGGVTRMRYWIGLEIVMVIWLVIILDP